MFRDDFATKAGQDKSTSLAVRRQQGPAGALDLSVRPFSLASFVCAFSYFSATCRLNFEVFSACYSRSRSFWFAGIARWVVARRWKDIGSLVDHSTFFHSRFQLALRCLMVTVQVFVSAPQDSTCQAPSDDIPLTVPLHLSAYLPLFLVICLRTLFALQIARKVNIHVKKCTY